MVTLAFAGVEVKIMYILETIAAIGLRYGLSIQLNKIMKLNEYQRLRSKFAFGQRSLRFKIETCFSRKQLSHLIQISHESLWV